jgi:hypothetical protein
MMKTLSSTLLAASLIVLAGPALSSQTVEEIVVTAKRPAAEMLSDMTDEIVAETNADLRANQPAVVAPKVRVELPALAGATK